MSKDAFQTMADMFKAIYNEPTPFYDNVVWNTIKFKWPERLRRSKKKRQRKKDLKKYNSTRFYGPVILNGGDNEGFYKVSKKSDTKSRDKNSR